LWSQIENDFDEQYSRGHLGQMKVRFKPISLVVPDAVKQLAVRIFLNEKMKKKLK